MADAFELTTEMRPGGAGEVALVRAKGDLDMATSDALAAELASEACRASVGVVLDLTEVPFMDSSGLRAVLVSVEELDCPLAAIVSPGSAIARLIEVTEVGGVLPSYSTQDEAFAALPELGDGNAEEGEE
jgi:stage II sporulation protein AA (anti-sigma F factor antagonist)